MAISETARKTHDEVFPNHFPTLAVTDPKLIEYFDNFTVDEVLRYRNLDTKTRLMVRLEVEGTAQCPNSERSLGRRNSTTFSERSPRR